MTTAPLVRHGAGARPFGREQDAPIATSRPLLKVCGAQLPTPDAFTFLKTLCGCHEAQVRFQTFDDVVGRKDRSLARVLHGSIHEHAATLASLNRRGAGVFVTVNRTDPRGRREQNVLGLRVLFVDADDVALPSRWPLEPSILVESKRGRHAYWLLHPGEPLELFGPAQAQLSAVLGTDPKVKDLPRVMRLPGTLHQKGEPFSVRLISAEPENVYAIWQVQRAFWNGLKGPA